MGDRHLGSRAVEKDLSILVDRKVNKVQQCTWQQREGNKTWTGLTETEPAGQGK